NANQDFLGHSYLSNDVNNDVVNDGKLPVTILNHKAASNGRLRYIGEAEAFLLAFDQDADYDSPNFLWFRKRFRRFVYVDRIVVSPSARGHGYARALYKNLFNHALCAGHSHVVCEVNLDPPNLVSDAFHAALGFREIGQGVLSSSAKTVCYLCIEVGENSQLRTE
ncbi:GNAT family N-acetyltransferase, partial [Gluconacetobacter entanii]|uniref:GNAT family N-acetyltransferase n=2 Tax=Gluconacetobacter entanii TaxID=108528 RepID=UPI002A5A2B52